jgi:hypothetical protein
MSKFSELDIEQRNTDYVDMDGYAEATLVLQHSGAAQVVFRNPSVLFGINGSMRVQWRNRIDEPGFVDLPPAIAAQLRPLFFDE